MGGVNFKNYLPPGPVAAGFIQSLGPIDIIMGPAGSGKTVASAYKGPWVASAHMPVCKDGVIRVRQATIRNTYRDLARTCLASWYEIFPPDSPLTVKHEGGQDRPVVHKLAWHTFREGMEIPVEFEMQFGAIGDANIEQFIKGYEVSLGWGNECDLLDERVLPLLLQRTGRFPKVSDIADAELRRFTVDGHLRLPRMVWGDMNPPDIDHWTYRDMVEKPVDGFRLHAQPSGLAENAENRVGKPFASYELEARTMPAHLVKRYVHGEFGYSLDGTPVYPEWRMDVHRAGGFLEPVEELPIGLGLDAGGSPACGIGQFMPNGQLRMLAEICSDPGTGPERFAEAILETLFRRFKGFAISEAYGDPSAWYGADKIAGNLAFMEIVARKLNVSIMPAPSNEPSLRQEAVRWYLGGMIDGHTPRLLVDPRLKYTVGGFAAHYKLTKLASQGATDQLAVVKNMYSHIHDGWQYLCLGRRGRAGVITDRGKRAGGKNVVSMGAHRAKADFNVWDA